MGFQIAIDGPAGAGKSTIAKLVAGRLGFTYMDTGAMYRAVGLLFDAQEKFPEGSEEIQKVCDAANIDIKFIDGSQRIFLNGEDVSDLIRTEHAGNTASFVSTFPEVRTRLVALQQELSRTCDVVMDGRDIGTVVLPNADLKIFMEADIRVRAQRRFDQLREKGETPDMEQIIKDLEARDHQDRNRAVSPLKQADDAILIDTSDMNREEVTEEILRLYRKVKNGED